MALQNFVDKITVMTAAWLNQVDVLKETIFNSASSKSLARTALTSDAPMEISNGGTGSRGAGPTWLVFLANLFPFIWAYINPRTTAEVSCGVTPVDYSYKAYEASRYGVLFDNATNNTTAINNWFLAAITAGVPATASVNGTARHLALNAFSGDLYIKGLNGYLTRLGPMQGGSWPYASSTAPMMTSTFSFEAENIGFDMGWTMVAHGAAGGAYNDGASPATWGGNWYGTFTGPRFKVTRCAFFDITRCFWVNGATDVEFTFNKVDSQLGDSQAICATSNCTNVRKEHNFLVGPKWTDYVAVTHAYTGLAALYCYSDTNVIIADNDSSGYQFVQNGNALVSERIIFTGNLIDTPVADTAFQNYKYAVICDNIIRKSGDMGIATDNAQYVVCCNNLIDGVMVGGINLGGVVGGTICGNIVKDWMQGYTLINLLGNRYSSSAGAWGSAITLNFAAPDTGGSMVTIGGNSCSMPNLPPVSDTFGAVRNITQGILVQTTTSAPNRITCTVFGNYVQPNFAQLPVMFVSVPVYGSLLSGKSGTPQQGETFANGANSFCYIGDNGIGTNVQYKRLVGTTPPGTVFTGALSGATLTIAGAAQGPFWFGVKESMNIDWTETAN